MKNILNAPFKSLHQSAPFDQIKTSDFIPALEIEIKETLKKINQICTQTELPSFENTLEALNQSGEQLGDNYQYTFQLKQCRNQYRTSRSSTKSSTIIN